MTLALLKKLFLTVMTSYFVVYVVILAYDVMPYAAYGDIIELAGMGIAFGVFIVGLCRMRKEHRLPWIFFMMTELLLFIGEAMWSVYDHILGIDPGGLSYCDFFYIASTTSCIIGTIIFLRQNGKTSIAAFSADLVISLVAAAGLIYIYLIFPALENSSEISGELLLQIAYPVFDFGLLFGSLVIFFSVGRDRYSSTSLLLMLSGFFIIFITDQMNLLFGFYELDYTKYIEPLWPCAYCLLGMACLLSTEEEKREGAVQIASQGREKAIEIARMIIPYLITFSVLAVVFIRYQLYNFTFCWAVFLIVILSVRQFYVLMSNNRLSKELRRLNRKAMQDAQMDYLTKLANRRYINETLAQLKEEADGRPLGILFIDIDLFKVVNDTHGHDAGDKVLCSVADVIRESIRDTDMGGRFGGDEFIILLPGADAQVVSDVGGRILHKARAKSDLADLAVTLSIGGCAAQAGTDLNALIKAADEALYAAKDGGRNRMVMWEEHTSRESVSESGLKAL